MPLTMNCGPVSQASGTSGSSWRAALSTSSPNIDAWTAKRCRQLSYMAEFTSDIQHIPDHENVVADALSRSSSSSSRPLADLPGLITEASPAPVAVDLEALNLLFDSTFVHNFGSASSANSSSCHIFSIVEPVFLGPAQGISFTSSGSS